MTRKQRTINIALWLAQASLASALLFSGFIKLTQPNVDVNSIWSWTIHLPNITVLVAWIELLMGIGIIIPELLRTAMHITVWTAYTYILWTVAYAIFVATLGDWRIFGSNLPYLLLAVFIAWGRQKSAYTTPS